MSEKSKWFRPSLKASSVMQLGNSGGVSIVDATGLLFDIGAMHRRGRLSLDAYDMLASLCLMSPIHRLSRNLKVALSLLAEHTIMDIMTEGLSKKERLMLLELENLHAPSNIRAVGQGLLDVHARQQLVAATQNMFQEERGRKWGIKRNEP